MADYGVNALFEQEQFVAQPFVCGALGPDEREYWPTLLAASPADIVVLRNGVDDRFAASSGHGLERTSEGWCWGRYIARADRPEDVSVAAHELGLAGYWVTARATVVHVDGLGVHDIFVRAIGDTIYFSNRIAPLVKLSRERLHVNWSGWFSCFFLKMFSGADTPFAEITRLVPGERIVLSDGHLSRETALAEWLTSPRENCSWNDLLDVLMDAVPRKLPVGADLTLSGGLDSRLILAALLKHGQSSSLTMWSTYHEDGTDADIRIAKQIAKAERLPWNAVDYSVPAWRQSHDIVVKRLEHMTAYHGWYVPLANTVHSRRGPLLDGLAGDVLLRYHDRVPTDRQSARAARIWSQLGGGNAAAEGVFHPKVLKLWGGKLFDAWRKETTRWDDHLYGESLMRLFTRTCTGIAEAPFRLFGPERQVLTPFMDPAVVRVVLATPPLPSFNERDLRPRLLAELSPGLAAFESTSSPTSVSRWKERGRTDAVSIRAFARKVAAMPSVSGIFADDFLDRINDTRRISGNMSFALRTGAMMADWLTLWDDWLYPANAPV